MKIAFLLLVSLPAMAAHLPPPQDCGIYGCHHSGLPCTADPAGCDRADQRAELLLPMGALCPPNSCNPFNGCMEGCSGEQKRCADFGSCAGQEIGTACRWDDLDGHSGAGYCSAEAVAVDGVECGCE